LCPARRLLRRYSWFPWRRILTADTGCEQVTLWCAQFTSEVDAITPPARAGGAWTATMIYTFTGSVGSVTGRGPCGLAGLPCSTGPRPERKRELGRVFLAPPATAGAPGPRRHCIVQRRQRPRKPGRVLTRAGNDVLYRVTKISAMTGPSTILPRHLPLQRAVPGLKRCSIGSLAAGDKVLWAAYWLVAQNWTVVYGTSTGATYGCGTV
jgi:hypothetical protein